MLVQGFGTSRDIIKLVSHKKLHYFPIKSVFTVLRDAYVPIISQVRVPGLVDLLMILLILKQVIFNKEYIQYAGAEFLVLHLQLYLNENS